MLAIAKASRPERVANATARARASRALERELADILVSFREAITIEQAEAAVFAGNARVIVNAAAPNILEAQLVAAMGESLEEALEAGARIGMRFAPPTLAGVSPGLATEAAVAFVERQGASAVLGITQGTQAGIQEVLTLALQDQIAPVRAAQWIGDLAGLTPRQVRAVDNFRKATTARLVPVEEALTPQVQRVIDLEVDRYRDRQLLLRGRTIAETETQAAITRGEQAFWDQAVSEGAVDAEDVFKTWRTVLDSHVCRICEPIHGQTVPYGETFITAAGTKIGPPAHPRCRCYIEYAEGDEPSTRPDQGAAAVRAAENRRLLNPDTLQDDLARARSGRMRTSQRLSRVRPGSRTAHHLEASLATSTATVQSLQGRLERFGLG